MVVSAEAPGPPSPTHAGAEWSLKGSQCGAEIKLGLTESPLRWFGNIRFCNSPIKERGASKNAI